MATWVQRAGGEPVHQPRQGRYYARCPAAETQQSGVPGSAWVPILRGLSGTILQPTSTPDLHGVPLPRGGFSRATGAPPREHGSMLRKLGLGRDKERSPRVPQDPGASATRLKRAALAYWTRKVPGSDTAPGPGRLAEASTVPLPVAEMQNTEASVAFAAVPGLTGPAGVPVSLIVRQAVLPKQPTCVAVWPGQKRPFGLVLLAGPVVSGERSTAITPTCEPSMQMPPPGVQG